MKAIQSVAILGAGAVGAYFAQKFYDAPAFSLNVIARGARLERLKKDGIVVNGTRYPFPVIDPAQATATVDLLIVALKHSHLTQALPGLEKLIGEQTIILSVMNGLDSEEHIAALYGVEKTMYGISLAIDSVREGNRVVYASPGVHYFGEATNRELSPRVLCVKDAFERAEIAYKIPEDMRRFMWWKFLINVGVNQASAVMRAPYAVMQESRQAQALMEALMREVIALAVLEGIDLSERDIEQWYPVLNSLSPAGKTSMLQDVEAGRKTEVDVFAGKVVQLGEKHGLPTPVNRTVLQIIRGLESLWENYVTIS